MKMSCPCLWCIAYMVLARNFILGKLPSWPTVSVVELLSKPCESHSLQCHMTDFASIQEYGTKFLKYIVIETPEIPELNTQKFIISDTSSDAQHWMPLRSYYLLWLKSPPPSHILVCTSEFISVMELWVQIYFANVALIWSWTESEDKDSPVK